MTDCVILYRQSSWFLVHNSIFKEVFGYYPPTRISEEIAQPQMNVNFVESASAMASAFMKPHQELKGNGRYSPAAQEPGVYNVLLNFKLVLKAFPHQCPI